MMFVWTIKVLRQIRNMMVVCVNISLIVKSWCFTFLDNFISGIGALRGLIGKSGATPARSRHCIGEWTHETPLGRKSWEGLGEQWSRARRTACLTITVFTHARWGGDSDTVPVLIFFPAFIAGIFVGMTQNVSDRPPIGGGLFFAATIHRRADGILAPDSMQCLVLRQIRKN